MGQGPPSELNLFSLLLHFNKVNLRKKLLKYGYTSTDLVYIAVGYAIDRVFSPKICLFKTDGWHFGPIHLANTSIF